MCTKTCIPMADSILPGALYTVLLRVERHSEGARFTLGSVDVDTSTDILAIDPLGISLTKYHVPAALLPGVEISEPLAGGRDSRGRSSAKEERKDIRGTHNGRAKLSLWRKMARLSLKIKIRSRPVYIWTGPLYTYHIFCKCMTSDVTFVCITLFYNINRHREHGT